MKNDKNLPINLYGQFSQSLILDEDFSQAIQDSLQDLNKTYLTAHDVLEVLKSPDVQARFGCKTTFTVRTARNWMKRMGFHYGKEEKGMYINGHERDDVVEYRQRTFLLQWAGFCKCMEATCECPQITHNQDCDAVPQTSRPLILLTHDESTFYAHDQHLT